MFKKNGILYLESFGDAVERRIHDEMGYVSNPKSESVEVFPDGIISQDNMQLVGVVFNWLQNYDYSFTCVTRVDLDSKNIQIFKGKKNTALYWQDTDFVSLIIVLE